MRITGLIFFVINLMAILPIHGNQSVVQSDIFYQISKNNLKAVKAWVKSKPDLSVRNQQGESVLHAAVLTGNRKMVKMLLKAGANVNALDTAGKTSLDYVVEHAQIKIIYDLVKKGGKVTCHDNVDQATKILKKHAGRSLLRFVAFSICIIAVTIGVAYFMYAIPCLYAYSLEPFRVGSFLIAVSIPVTFGLSIREILWRVRASKVEILESVIEEK